MIHGGVVVRMQRPLILTPVRKSVRTLHPLGHEGVNESLLAGNRLILTNSGVISTASWAGSLAAKTAVAVVGLETVEVLGDSNPI